MTRYDAAVSAAKTRLRPILMTSLAFILGVVPLVVSFGAGAEMRQSLGTAVFFGMLGVTFFGLVFTPVFYVVSRRVALLFARHRDQPQRRRRGRSTGRRCPSYRQARACGHIVCDASVRTLRHQNRVPGTTAVTQVGVRQHPPRPACQHLRRSEARFVGHLMALRHPVAEIDVGQLQKARALDQPQDSVGAQGTAAPAPARRTSRPPTARPPAGRPGTH